MTVGRRSPTIARTVKHVASNRNVAIEGPTTFGLDSTKFPRIAAGNAA